MEDFAVYSFLNEAHEQSRQYVTGYDRLPKTLHGPLKDKDDDYSDPGARDSKSLLVRSCSNRQNTVVASSSSG